MDVNARLRGTSDGGGYGISNMKWVACPSRLAIGSSPTLATQRHSKTYKKVSEGFDIGTMGLFWPTWMKPVCALV